MDDFDELKDIEVIRQVLVTWRDCFVWLHYYDGIDRELLLLISESGFTDLIGALVLRKCTFIDCETSAQKTTLRLEVDRSGTEFVVTAENGSLRFSGGDVILRRARQLNKLVPGKHRVIAKFEV